jgi:hypothetical protein
VTAMRISVASWRTGEDDVERSIRAIRSAAATVLGARGQQTAWERTVAPAA